MIFVNCSIKYDNWFSRHEKVEITARERLEAEISGSGKVYYKGNPVVNANISGSGKVVHQE